MSKELKVEHHTAHLNGIRIHWVSAGSGPVVYLLHGFPETWYGWRHQIPELAEHYTVIAPDLRGYGATEKAKSGYDKRTMANDVIALMDHLGHDKIALIGHDRGARVATRFAKDHPDRLDRLVVVDNVPTRIVADTYDIALARAGYWFFTFLAVPDLPETLVQGREREFLTHFFQAWSYNPELFTPADIDVYVEAYRQPGALRAAFDDYRAGAIDTEQDREDADRLIACRTLVIWGTESDVVGRAYDLRDVWRQMVEQPEFLPIARCGHLTQEEQPHIVTSALLDFLANWH
ncbi:alpha/beta fold hydrolase [Streptomyces sp. S1D4-11]|nr:alpha/beta hydrolase [Streptomyces sp. S1D4-11]QIZ00743.1 alpha/beta hydrolase [Streptomyces sp. S1D4-11]